MEANALSAEFADAQGGQKISVEKLTHIVGLMDLETWSLDPDSLGSNPSSIIHHPCDLEQVLNSGSPVSPSEQEGVTTALSCEDELMHGKHSWC